MHSLEFSQIKVPGGKLLQLEKKENLFRITGDFFCYPEKVIEALEDILNSPQNSDEKKDKLSEVFNNPEVTIIGFGVEDLWGLYEKLKIQD